MPIASMSEKAVYDALLMAMFALAPIVFMLLLFTTAPYGRYSEGRAAAWGPSIKVKVGWMIQGSPSVIAFAIFFAMGKHATNMLPLVFLALWEMHYLQRTYIFPLLMRGTRRTLRLSMIAMALLFYVINGYLNGRYLTQFSGGYSSGWLADPRFVTGVIAFFTGMALNLHSDNILRNLRQPGEASYKIPRGGMFKFVSCGNYFGEIVQWCGWAIATWSLPGLCYCVWTAANLVPRAISHHRWYLNRFPEYPKKHKALIPFIL
jgi:3-oxo-5-alpha-steroid 4-dehydrogenase 1